MKNIIYILGFCFLVSFTSCSWTSEQVDYSISNVSEVSHGSNTDWVLDYIPDGKLCVVKNGTEYQMFWAECDSYRTTASTPYVEDHISQVNGTNLVFGKSSKEAKIPDVNENGSWFIGVFPLDGAGNYVGFFHGESHWDNTGAPAHKSVCVTYSSDYGETWKDSAPIIVDEPKGSSPDWTGVGDGCVVWDAQNKRWLCYYQGRNEWGLNTICIAASKDPKGASGTWKKWDGTSFSQDAYNPKTRRGGKNHGISAFGKVRGANPSVMWNTYLNKWIMVYATWGHRICLSSSSDGVHWTKPQEIMGSDEHPAWYPNLISEQGDLIGGQTVKMYFSLDQRNDGKRKIGMATITFK